MNKKTALITGSSRGIGRAIAILFARNNYNVVINYNKSEKEAQELYDMLSKENLNVKIFKADVSNVQEANALVNYTIGQFENIDVLVNNAGISKPCLFTDISYEQWDEMISTNLSSVFYVTKKALQYMLPNQSGHIINISSMWGQVGASCEVHYSASKAAVIGLTKALAKEVGPSHIQVNCVAPGVIRTAMNSHLDKQTLEMLKEETPLGVIGTTEDVAQMVGFLASDHSDFITGQVFGINGGMVI